MNVPVRQPAADHKQFRPSLHLAPGQLEAIYQELDRAANQSRVTESRRSEPRASFRPDKPVELTVIHPAGGVARFLVHPFNLSRNGIAFLHGGFLHRNTTCTLTLMQREDNIPVTVEGVVRWCQHCNSTCHLIGVQLSSPIDIRRFVDSNQFKESVLKTQVTDPSSLAGRVVLIESQPIERELFQVMLADTSIDIEFAHDLDSTQQILRGDPVDMIVCGLDLGSGHGEDVIAALRAQGFNRPIVALTAVTDGSRLVAASRSGANDVVRKPIESPLLLRILAHHLASLPVTVCRTPLQTTLEPAIAEKRRVGSFVARAIESAATLEAAVGAQDVEASRVVCQTLRVSADAYGFPLIAEAARIALAALDASHSVEESRDDLRRLVMLVRRMTWAPPAPSPPPVDTVH